jgi:hypothetical protein
VGSAGAPATLANPITGFAQGDTIDMAGLVADGDTYAGGVLILTNSGSVVAQLTVSTPVTNPVFTLGTDGNGGTLIGVQSAPPPVTNLFDFVFTYNGGADYYYGTVADNGSFGYSAGETFARGDGTYDIFSETGTTTEASGTVSVTYYSHGGPGQASYTPTLTAMGDPDGTGGLGSESDSILGTDGLKYPFSASMEASFTPSSLFGFVYTYAEGAAYYSGTVADNGSLGYAKTANSPSPYLPGADGYYYIFSEGVTGEPSGTVAINYYRDGATAMTYSTAGGGSAGLGSETGSFLAANGSTFDFSPTQEATDPLSATMVLRDGSNGEYEIYELGSNAILGAAALGQVGTEWVFAGLGDFNGGDTSDMILRDSNTGAFEVYDIGNNSITAAAPLGQVGLEWQVAGFGNFNGSGGGTDMMTRDVNTGAFEVFDIADNAVTSASAFGQVGLEWQVAGFGDFSSNPNETDMLLRDTQTGTFEVYDIAKNATTAAGTLGQVGLEWQVAGFGDFSSNPNETDMLLRNVNTGAFELYDIQNNRVTSATAIGQVGLEWQVAGFGPLNGAGTADMVLRDTQTGAFEVYDLANNQLTGAASLGQAGLEWQVGGFAPDALSILAR